MLIPRFSIRWILLLTAVCAVLFIVMGQAVQGSTWAIAVSLASLLIALIFIFYAVTFVAAYGLAKATRAIDPKQAPTDPFARPGEFPPQMVPSQRPPDAQ